MRWKTNFNIEIRMLGVAYELRGLEGQDDSEAGSLSVCGEGLIYDYRIFLVDRQT